MLDRSYQDWWASWGSGPSVTPAVVMAGTPAAFAWSEYALSFWECSVSSHTSMYGVRVAMAASRTPQVSFLWKGPAVCTNRSTPLSAASSEAASSMSTEMNCEHNRTLSDDNVGGASCYVRLQDSAMSLLCKY